MMRPKRRVLSFLTTAVVVAFAGTGHAGLFLDSSGWEWSNPQPQGETLLDVAVSDATHAFASGEHGTLIATADAGETWSSIASGVGADLTRVSVTGASLLTGGACLARRSDDGGTTFTRLRFTANESLCGVGIAATSFPNPTQGVLLLRDGTVLTTGDGGLTFARATDVPLPSPAAQATDLIMTSPAIGFASTSAGALLRTADGGNSWGPVLNAPGPISSLAFADGVTAYAASGVGIYKSVDAGLNWTILPGSGLLAGLERIRCANPNVCIATTVDGSSVVRTADGGATFSTITPASGGVRGIAFFSPTRVVAVGRQGRTVLSDDGGATWRPVGRRLDRRMTQLRANPDGLAYAWGPGAALAVTADRGATWREFAVPTATDIRSASFATADVGYAVDLGGTVFRTSNGGTSWQILDVGGDFGPLEVHALAAERIVVIGQGGAMRRSSNGGQSFVASATPAIVKGARRAVRAGTALALHVPRAIATSPDGATWRIVRAPVIGGRSRPMRVSQCTSAAVCWAVTVDRRLYRTVDGGRSWTDRSAGVGAPFITGLAFENRNRGYLSAGAYPSPSGIANVLRTVDGGRTWTPERLAISAAIPRIQPASGIDYALDELLGSIFTTTTGGLRGTPTVVTATASTRAITRRTRVTISGRLTPALGGEQVVVSTSDQRNRIVTVASNGRFSTSFLISKTTAFVAQWAGDRTRAGDGSAAVTVRRR